MSENIDTAVQPNDGVVIPGEGVPAHGQETSDVQSRAKSMGWVDKDSYRGPAEKWVDADEFVRRGEEELPVLRERNRDLSRKYTDLETKLERTQREFDDRVRRQEAMARIALEQQRANLAAQYEAAKVQAVEIGDVSRYQQLDRDQQQAIHNFDQHVHQRVMPQRGEPPAKDDPEIAAKIDAWVVENPWFVSDRALNQYAQTVHMHLQRTRPDLSLDDNFSEVAKYVRQKFPEKFGPAQGGPPAVEGGNGLSSGGGKRTRGYSDLPAEAKRDVDEFIRAGAFKTRDEGARAYWSHNT